MVLKKVAIAGASGFVGQALVKALDSLKTYELVGIGRSNPPSEIDDLMEWRRCDLFSLKDAELGLKGIDIAYYLVHSMMPSAKLSQGHFSDYDLVAADNFARAAKQNGVQQLIYLAGILPEGSSQKLSSHLRSRWEVEKLLASSGIPLTTLRAALIIGGLGSSFLILQKLVEKTPIILCPPQLNTDNQPIALSDAILYLTKSCDNRAVFGKTIEIGGPEIVTYRQLLQHMTEVLKKRRLILRGPAFPIRLASWPICWLTGAPYKLVAPLLASLKYSMTVRDKSFETLSPHPRLTLKASLAKACREHLRDQKRGESPVTYQKKGARFELKDVRSIQRLPMPPNSSARWVAQEYLRWLPRHLRFILKVSVRGPCAHFFIFNLPWPLLILELSPERSQKDRQLFYIRGGLLVRESSPEGDRKIDRGRLEFREMLNKSCIIAAIHEFRPRVPWYIYIYTQALIHLWVMKAFSRHLARTNP